MVITMKGIDTTVLYIKAHLNKFPLVLVFSLEQKCYNFFFILFRYELKYKFMTKFVLDVIYEYELECYGINIMSSIIFIA